jgi:hypothetical protein
MHAVDDAIVGKIGRPVAGDDLEKARRQSPVAGEVRRERQVEDIAPAHIARDRGLVDQRRQLVGGGEGGGGRQVGFALGGAPALDQACKGAAASFRCDRGRQVRVLARQQRVLVGGVEIAQRADVGGKQRAAGGAKEGERKFAGRATVGREDQGVGERVGTLGCAGRVHQPGRQRIKKGGRRGQREDARGGTREYAPRTGQAPGPIACRRASASSRAPGSPTCIQNGVITVPKNRFARMKSFQ